THGLTGAIIGCGLVAAGRQVNFVSLGTGFVLPLLLTPALAVILAVSLYALFRFVRLRLGIRKEWCVCIGKSRQLVPVPQPATVILVTTANLFGLPVSTTHVSVGSLFGVGLVTRQADKRVATGILLSWVLTVPCAALTSGLVYWLMGQ